MLLNNMVMEQLIQLNKETVVAVFEEVELEQSAIDNGPVIFCVRRVLGTEWAERYDSRRDSKMIVDDSRKAVDQFKFNRGDVE